MSNAKPPNLHQSKTRVVSYSYWPVPEVHPIAPIEIMLHQAQAQGVVTQWHTSRTGQSWHFEGSPGPKLRKLRAKIFALLGGSGHALTWEELQAKGGLP